eukprot:Hpha_TRINITY_DN16987_c1_g6::TRINITY_DN16987_c1_g6_i1::g.56359::m.56359/K05692/ACTB_G1; actin beta/gamma 1
MGVTVWCRCTKGIPCCIVVFAMVLPLVRLIAIIGGHSFTTSPERKIVDEMKKEVCRVALDPLQSTFEATQYELPDGKTITLGKERFMAPELLFNPAIIGDENPGGVHRFAADSIMKCDKDLQQHMYANVILAGGSTLIPGFSERLHGELTREGSSLPSPPDVVRVVPAVDTYSVWQGGSMLASVDGFDWITKQRYDEYGPGIVHRVCF